jgi:hypothetical protein
VQNAEQQEKQQKDWEEVNTMIDKEKEQPLHIKQSEYAKGFLNTELQRLVQIKNNITFLKLLEVQTAITHNDAKWKEVHKALSNKTEELADCHLSVKAAKETLDTILENEKTGKYLI